ncbi:MAG TPA: LysM peptidoglycan-binding domain-containing protein [Leucothrix sp.]|nr:LysM peptidoglycan-binding domain-containing protein [Leucothrix sp.]
MYILNKLKTYHAKLKNSTALLFLAASLGLLTLFAGKIYFDKNNTLEQAVSPSSQDIPVQSINQDNTTNVMAINELTTQLLTERQITEDLHAQNQELIQRLQDSTSQPNTSDNDYLTALDTINKTNPTKNDKKSLEETDYYNKISLSLDKENTRQNQINQFIDMNNKEENIYFDTLKVESYIRQNEVRSIVLKKGESIWMLAKRAYGNGFLYHKIMKANPQITEKNAKYLKVGTIIRVPR